MALVNFFNHPPTDKEIVELLNDDELVVFNHTTTGARELGDRIEKLVDFNFNTHNENTVPKWDGDDYFVMVRSDFSYSDRRDALRELAKDWIAANCTGQVKHI